MAVTYFSQHFPLNSTVKLIMSKLQFVQLLNIFAAIFNGQRNVLNFFALEINVQAHKMDKMFKKCNYVKVAEIKVISFNLG